MYSNINKRVDHIYYFYYFAQNLYYSNGIFRQRIAIAIYMQKYVKNIYIKIKTFFYYITMIKIKYKY